MEEEKNNAIQALESEQTEKHMDEFLPQGNTRTPSHGFASTPPARSQQLFHDATSPNTSVRDWMIEMPSPCCAEAVRMVSVHFVTHLYSFRHALFEQGRLRPANPPEC